MDAESSLTNEQRQAVTTTDGDVLISAAAGSGKTRVLAERCAYLVCDAPVGARCNIDELLVLTFTDAAATEMRSRIVETIRKRIEKSPLDDRLHQQLILTESAQISTIHSFCLWMIRRWFDDVGVDPMASVLAADEAMVLREQVLDELFEQQYATAKSGGASLGEDLLDATGPEKHEFLNLISVYGLGEDGDIRRFVMKLYNFITSLPDADDWLKSAVSDLSAVSPPAMEELARTLRQELRMQITHAHAIATAISNGPSSGHDYGSRVSQFVDALSEWSHALTKAQSASEGLDQVRERIASFEFERIRAARDLSDAEKQARERARKLSEEVKDQFNTRLKERFGYFSSREWAMGLEKIAPPIRTLVELVRRFSAQYAARKRQLSTMDFSDLERFAFNLVKDADSPIACTLRARFHHVLVDEFQDINPLQDAILREVSRRPSSDVPGNLFAVGDVKQSIYRFRLAEPEIFLKRLQCMRDDSARHGKAMFLQSSFRSRVEILDAVNFVFRKLMIGEQGGLVYDTDAELRPGTTNTNSEHVPVELHLLERRIGSIPFVETEAESEAESPSEDNPSGEPDMQRALREGDPPARWDPIVREAYFIAEQIAKLMDGGESCDGRPLRYSDIAVLLRSTKINADRVAMVLGAMGIPAFAEVGGSLLGALEVREVVAALEVLNNLQQDIPLAAVLRSGIFGDQFNEDELVEIRLTDKVCPFHESVRRYADDGPDKALRNRLQTFFRRIRTYRTNVTRRPLSHTVWNLLQRQGYLAHAAGLPCGAQRKANLLKLYELSRRFSSHRNQGLHRFLKLLRSISDEGQPIAVAPTGGAGDNVVRIMSIHHAKGTEYPVVFVAGLGTKFNLGDRNGRIIFERKSRIGLRGIDSRRMIEYPTAVHQLVGIEVESSTHEEELRILYVAMTRAKKRLIMLGSVDGANRLDEIHDRPLTSLRIATARTPLEWLLPVIGAVEQGNAPPIRVTVHDAAEISSWSMIRPSGNDEQRLLDAVGAFAALPPEEPGACATGEVDDTLSRINSIYPYLATSSIPATLAASQFGRFNEVNSRPSSFPPQTSFPASPELQEYGEFDAAQRGTIIHRILQYLDFDVALRPGGVARELERLVAEGILDTTELPAISADDLSWFAGTALAENLRKAGPSYHRELRFITTEPLCVFEDTMPHALEDRVLVRGMIDGIVESPNECEIIDFKSDAITASEALERCETYRPQMEVYARSVERLWCRPVRRCRLIFLRARCIIDLNRPLNSP